MWALQSHRRWGPMQAPHTHPYRQQHSHRDVLARQAAGTIDGGGEGSEVDRGDGWRTADMAAAVRVKVMTT